MPAPVKNRDERNAVIEVIPGIGGREAKLWADDLREMLSKYAQRLGFKVQSFGHLHQSSHLIVEGQGAYSVFKYEAGIHEVQRVPSTDHYGRIHSSTASVIVLPEIREREYQLQNDDLVIEVFQGAEELHPGVSIKHQPSGLQVSVQRSQHELDNLQDALRLLRARVYNLESSGRRRRFSFIRKQQRAEASRARRIRTYNYKEGRVRDHRSGFKSMQLKQIMDGGLEQFTLAMRDREKSRQEQQRQA